MAPRPGAARALRSRGARAGVAQPSAHRGDLRHRGGRRSTGSGARAHRRPDTRRLAERRPDSGPRRAAHRDTDRQRSRRGARARHHPSRSQAGQRDSAGSATIDCRPSAEWTAQAGLGSRRRAHRQGGRLRAGQGVRDGRRGRRPRRLADADAGSHARGGADRHRGLHEPRAGARGTRRSADRSLGVRLCALRDADRPRSVSSGATLPDTLAAIVTKDPDWSALPSDTAGGGAPRAAALPREGLAPAPARRRRRADRARGRRGAARRRISDRHADVRGAEAASKRRPPRAGGGRHRPGRGLAGLALVRRARPPSRRSPWRCGSRSRRRRPTIRCRSRSHRTGRSSRSSPAPAGGRCCGCGRSSPARRGRFPDRGRLVPVLVAGRRIDRVLRRSSSPAYRSRAGRGPSACPSRRRARRHLGARRLDRFPTLSARRRFGPRSPRRGDRRCPSSRSLGRASRSSCPTAATSSSSATPPMSAPACSSPRWTVPARDTCSQPTAPPSTARAISCSCVDRRCSPSGSISPRWR